MKQILAALMLTVVSAPVAFAQMSGQEFVEKAAYSGQFEIKSSELALQRLKDEGLRDFANEMIQDHTKANAKLKEIAQQENLSVPDEMDKAHKEKLNQLENAGNFDEKYQTMQLEGHKKAVKLFESYSQDGDNEALRGFAERTLTTLKDHKEDIEALTRGAETTE